MSPAVRVFTDDDLGRLDPSEAVAWTRKVYADLADGKFVSPPRLSSRFGETRVSFSFGGYPDRGAGFRINGWGSPNLEPITITHDAEGRLSAIVAGYQFLGLRAGAIGGVGVDVLAKKSATKLAIIGSSRNGWWHVWAATGVRPIETLQVFSPNPQHREAFAERARTALGIDARARDTAREAVEDADVVILSTDSKKPVIDASWIKEGTHVSSFGAKSVAAQECPPELVPRVAVVATDIPADLTLADQPAWNRPLFPEPQGVEVHSLGELIGGQARGRVADDEITLFLLTGLGGTETVLAQLLAERSA